MAEMGDRRSAPVSDASEITGQETAASSGLRWYQGVPRYAWIVLLIATLGWLFDAMDQNLFNLVRAASVTELLQRGGSSAPLPSRVQEMGGNITAIFLIGWAFGGFIFGMLGDRLGRSRTMVITILIYATFTGLNAFVQTPWQYGVCRFLTALGVGGEFAAGAALVAEIWPARSRPMALGTMQALSAVGNMTAAGITYLLAGQSWRNVYLVGAVPALLVVWIRVVVKEPERWKAARRAAEQASGESREVGNILALFRDPTLRRNTIAGVLLALAGVGGLWGVGFFLPDLTTQVLRPVAARLPDSAKRLNEWKSAVFFVQQVGALLGMYSYALLAERAGRRPALLLFLLLAFGAVQGTFWGLRDLNTAFAWAFVLGFCALAPFSAFAVYFPELYPTRLRATGVGFCYNCARLLAAGAPFLLGGLTKHFEHHGRIGADAFRTAASVVACVYLFGLIGLIIAPETRGRPLPE